MGKKKKAPLIDVCIAGDLETAKSLLQQGADIHVNQDDPLCAACVHGHLEIVKHLVLAGANVNVRNGYPLTIAVKKGHFEIVKLLLETSSAGNLDEHMLIAYQTRQLELFELLVNTGADINRWSNYNVLSYSCKTGDLEMVKLCLKLNADPEIKNGTPLRLACIHGHTAIVKLLLEQGVNLPVYNDCNDYNWVGYFNNEIKELLAQKNE